MKWTAVKNEFIVVLYFNQKYHSPQCRKIKGKYFKEYDRLGSESKNLKAEREQIQLRYIGTVFK